MGKIKRAIGLMSGTSMDGIDVALLQSDGVSRLQRLGGASFGYDAGFRNLLRRAIEDAAALTDRSARPGSLAQVEHLLTRRHGEAVERFLQQNGITPQEIDVIGFHGQSILHRPEAPRIFVAKPKALLDVPGVEVDEARRMLSVQLGDGAALARQSGIDVVYDLRAADCAAGGEGAPLVPIYHQALAGKLPQRPVAFLNIGGVANVTYVGPDGRLIAFDTGPGNALVDDWVRARTGEPYDRDGALAAAGQVEEDVLIELLTHEYFGRLPPKSLDRNSFQLDLGGVPQGGVSAVYEEGAITVEARRPGMFDALSLEDGAATLSAFTAAAVARAEVLLPEPPELWVVCGGGRRNRTLMTMIAGRVTNAVVPAEAVHLDGDLMEAEAFAFLAVRSLAGLPITFPSTTGVPGPMPGGLLARAQ